MDIVEDFLLRARAVAGGGRTVGLHEPTLVGNAETYVRDTVSSGWVSSVGAYVDRFESMLGEITGAHAVACVNGTSALEMALRLAGVRADDEVMMPALTFVASANAVAHVGAVPHFIDVLEDDLAITPSLVRDRIEASYRPEARALVNVHSGRRLGAIMAVHIFGNPADTPGLKAVADEFGVPLVEDAAEALGAKDVDGRHCGTTGVTGALSFNGNKIVTTGGGGAILTRDSEVARRAKHLTTTAKVPHRWEYAHDEVAWNHRMPNLNAALGCAQLEVLDSLLVRKARLAAAWGRAVHDLDGASLIRAAPGTRPNHWLTGIRFADEATLHGILDATNAAGIQTRPLWRPMHQLPMYARCPHGDLTTTDALARTVINVPSSAHLMASDA